MRKRFLRTIAFTTVLVLMLPSLASALTLRVPRHVLRSAPVSIEASSTDSTGTAILFVDGTAVRSVPLTPSASATLPPLALPSGGHKLRLGLRTREGLDLRPALPVTSWTEPMPPLLVSPSGGYSAAQSPVVIRAGASTTSLKLSIGGKAIKTLTVTPNKVVSFGTQSFPKQTTLTITASNPVSSKTYNFRISRLTFPWATCIIIDKSDFKLYWVKDNVLVKVYPIAHGKPNTPTPSATWRIGAKYHTDPGSVYGPRKMRLFRKVGSTYEYTRFLIHGTNEEWVIGTRASHGCIRMYNRHVLELFPQVPIGTMVQTRD